MNLVRSFVAEAVVARAEDQDQGAGIYQERNGGKEFTRIAQYTIQANVSKWCFGVGELLVREADEADQLVTQMDTRAIVQGQLDVTAW